MGSALLLDPVGSACGGTSLESVKRRVTERGERERERERER